MMMMKSKTNKSYKSLFGEILQNKKSLKIRYFTKTDACYDFRPFY